jgi:hypothetical protein
MPISVDWGEQKKGTAEPLPRPAPSLLAMSVDGENVIISPKHHQQPQNKRKIIKP